MEYLNGHDIGNHTDKQAIILSDGTISVTSVANAVGAGDVGEFNVALASLGRGRGRAAQDAPDVVVYDGGIIVMVGANVDQFTRKPIRRTDLNRYGDGMATRAITYVSWYHLFGPGEHTIRTVLGLPVSLLNSPEIKAHRRSIRRWLQDTHEFTVNGEQCVIHVETVKFQAQPCGAFADFVMDENGLAKDPGLLDVEIAVLDPGYQTVDTFVLKGGQVDRNETDGNSLGMREAVRLLKHQVTEMHGRRISDFEADRMIVEYMKHPRAEQTLTSRGQAVNITPLIQSSIKMTTDAVLDFLDEVWGDGAQFRHVLLVGGGALVMSDEIRDKYPHAVLLDDPINANARGLAKIARQMFE